MFLQVVDKGNQQVVVRANLSRRQRSLVTKIKCGVLPLIVETGRFKNIAREKRLCQICTLKKIETEFHFLFECPKLAEERENMNAEFDYIEGFSDMDEATKMKTILEANNVIRFSRHLEVMFEARRKHMYTVEKETRRQTQELQNQQHQQQHHH